MSWSPAGKKGGDQPMTGFFFAVKPMHFSRQAVNSWYMLDCIGSTIPAEESINPKVAY